MGDEASTDVGELMGWFDAISKSGLVILVGLCMMIALSNPFPRTLPPPNECCVVVPKISVEKPPNDLRQGKVYCQIRRLLISKCDLMHRESMNLIVSDSSQTKPRLFTRILKGRYKLANRAAGVEGIAIVDVLIDDFASRHGGGVPRRRRRRSKQ